MPNSIPNFRIGLQLADENGHGAEGEARYTAWAKDASIWSEWASDSDQWDPDALRIGLEVEANNLLIDKDFRLVMQASDAAGGLVQSGVGFGIGPKQSTPWASEGGGWSGLVLDDDLFDPNAFRVLIETRPWTSPRTIKDVRLAVQLYDDKGNEAGDVIAFTPWTSAGGGWSDYAMDRDQFDPDGCKVKMEIRFD